MDFLIDLIVIFSMVLDKPKVRWAPLHVPMLRRRQTFAILCFVGLLPLSMFCHLWSVVLLLFPLTTLPMAAYLVWIHLLDGSPEAGTRTPSIRQWRL